MADSELWEIYDKLSTELSETRETKTNNSERKSEETEEKPEETEEKSATATATATATVTATATAIDDKCPHCENSLSVDVLDGMEVCSHCGAEVGPYLSRSAEWRYYGNDDNKHRTDPNRCGSVINPLLPNFSFRTFIQGSGNEAFRKLHTWNNSNYEEKCLSEIFKVIRQKIRENNIPETILNNCNWMYKNFNRVNLIRGKNVRGLIAATVYFACKENEIFLTTKEICKMFEIKSLSNSCKEFIKNMYAYDKKSLTQIKITNIKNYINKLCVMLNLTDYLEDCQKCGVVIKSLGMFVQKTDLSLAFGCICYIVELRKLDLDKNAVVKSCNGISLTTVNKVLKKMALFPNLIRIGMSMDY